MPGNNIFSKKYEKSTLAFSEGRNLRLQKIPRIKHYLF